jgi:hypothetical protein
VESSEVDQERQAFLGKRRPTRSLHLGLSALRDDFEKLFPVYLETTIEVVSFFPALPLDSVNIAYPQVSTQHCRQLYGPSQRVLEEHPIPGRVALPRISKALRLLRLNLYYG